MWEAKYFLIELNLYTLALGCTDGGEKKKHFFFAQKKVTFFVVSGYPHNSWCVVV